MPVDIAALRRRWRRLMPGPAVPQSDGVFDRLVAAYSGTGRHYHDLAHINTLLGDAERERSHFSDPYAVELAIFFHDAVYDVMRNDNEAESARLADVDLSMLGFAPAVVSKVAALIAATAHGDGLSGSEDADTARFLDLDLAILAAPQERYAAYASAIRREYAAIPDAIYRAGRAKVLRSFLARPRIFLCSDHHVAWDASARSNLERECIALEGPTP